MAEGPASQGWKTSKHLLYGLISCRQQLRKISTNYPRGALQNSLSDFISCCPDEVSGGGGWEETTERKETIATSRGAKKSGVKRGWRVF